MMDRNEDATPNVGEDAAQAPCSAMAPDGVFFGADEALNETFARLSRELGGRLRRFLEEMRTAERKRADLQLHRQAQLLQARAEAQLRHSAERIRVRYQDAFVAREKRLRSRYAHLLATATQMSTKKQALQQVLREFQEKLDDVGQAQHELTEIGLAVARKLGELEELMPGAERASVSAHDRSRSGE